MRESGMLNEEFVINESYLDSRVQSFLEEYSDIIAEAAKQEVEEEPTVNVGGGAIAGLGVGPQGEPGVSKKNQKKHKKRIQDFMNRR